MAAGLRLVAWDVWYVGGRQFRGRTVAEWKALPSTGLLWITAYYENGNRVFYSGGDWYFIDGDRFQYVPTGDWGTWQPKSEGCKDCIKRGDGCSDEEFAAIEREAWATWL